MSDTRADLDRLEDLDGPDFRAAVEKEDRIWKSALQSLSSEIRRWESDFDTFQSAAYPQTMDYAAIQLKWRGLDIKMQHGIAGFTQNIWFLDGVTHHVVWSKKGVTTFGVDSDSHLFFTIEDIGAGAERLELTVYRWMPKAQKAETLWKSGSPVGPSAVFSKSHILYQGVENALRYHELWKADAITGESAVCIYTQPDKRIQLTLSEQKGTLFVQEANALFQRLGVIEHSQIRWMTPTLKSTLIPISSTLYATDRAIGPHALPAGEHIVDVKPVDHSDALFVTTVQKGVESLWFFVQTSWIPLLRPNEICHIEIVQESTTVPTFFLYRPAYPTTVFEFRGTVGMVEVLKFPAPLGLKKLSEGAARSADGTQVPYTVVSHVVTPKKLLVEGYGAYGMSSRRAYPVRWLPWLKRGYAVAFACPRGGREGGDPWYDGGRTAARKHHTFEDTAAVIEHVQSELKIAPKHTVFFGRSAGGWLAAIIAQKYGHLVGGVYAEVPYVDVLKTTSNPDLPLTQLEYDEFGDPTHRPSEYAALKQISPVDTVPLCLHVSRCPRLVIRTGLNDMQVLPYEALKWATRLREKRWKQVYVGIDHGSGHFAPPRSMNRQRAEDAVLLNAYHRSAERRRSTRGSKSTRGKRGAGKTRRLRTKSS